MRQTIRLGSFSGIPIGINWGLLLIAGFYTLNLAVGILPRSVADASPLAYWIFAAASVVLFFASILAHELGHSIVAQRSGIKVKEITLWFLGGVAVLDKEADDPKTEFRIAIAGPAVSVALAFAFGGLALVLAPLFGGGLLTFSLGYLALINFVLAIFNLIPAAPLDGGRVLASFLWSRNGNRHRARANAAKAGVAFGTGLMAVGIFGLFTGAGTFLLAFLGFFLRAAAGAERFRAEASDALEGAEVSTAMSPVVAPISSGVTAAGVQAVSGGYQHPVAFPLVSGGTSVGLVPSTVVATIPEPQRGVVDVLSLIHI